MSRCTAGLRASLGWGACGLASWLAALAASGCDDPADLPPSTAAPPAVPEATGCRLVAWPERLVFGEGEVKAAFASTRGGECIIERIIAGEDAFELLEAPELPLRLTPQDSARIVLRHRARAILPRGKTVRELRILTPELTGPLVLLEGPDVPAGCVVPVEQSVVLDPAPPGAASGGVIELENRCGRTVHVLSARVSVAERAFDLARAEQPRAIEPGAKDRLGVRFRPSRAAAYSGVVEVVTNTSGRQGHPFDLQATASFAAPAAVPAAVDFGSAVAGCAPPPREVEVFPAGEDPYVLDRIEIDGPDAAAFSVSEVIAGRTRVAPEDVASLAPIPAGDSATVRVRFSSTRTSPADHTAELRVIAGDDHAVAVIPLRAAVRAAAPSGLVTDSFTSPSAPKVDLLFVLDDDRAFAPFHARVRALAAALLDEAERTGAGYRIAAVIGHDAGEEAGALRECGGTTMVDKVNGTLPERRATLDCLLAPGPASRVRAPLGAALLALRRARSAGTFLRHDARLAIVVATNDRDRSVVQDSLLLAELADASGALHAEGAAVHVIAPAAGGGCARPRAGGDTRLARAAAATGGLLLDACTDWSAHAPALAAAIFALPDTWTLSVAASASSLAVSAGAGPATFRFDPRANTIAVEGAAPGAPIEARYAPSCLP